MVARNLAVDTAMLGVAGVATIAMAPHAGVKTDIVAMAIFAVSVLAVFAYAGLYRRTFSPHFLDDARKILGAIALVAMAMTFMRVLVLDNPDTADQAARAWLFASTYVLAARAALSLYDSSRRRAGMLGEKTLIVGAGAVGRRFAQRLIERPEFGLDPVAFLDDDPLEARTSLAETVPVLQSARSPGGELFGPGLETALEERRVTHVVISFSATSHSSELDLVRRCQQHGATVSMLPRLFEGVTDQIALERIGGIPLISVHPTDPRGWQYAVKYASDRAVSALAILLLSPLLLAAALATALTLGRPVIFKQQRVGIDGHGFDLLKFRTMRPPRKEDEAEAALASRFAEGLAPGGVEGVDRRTRVGRFLRATSIDELPQLLNVLRGDMSLVGPRPERPDYVSLFDESVYRYADRHRVKSGITGWSQVHGLRGKTSIADRVEWDNYYIENRSFWLDLKIIAMTIPALLRERSE